MTTSIDKLRAMVDGERLRASAVELLEGLDADAIHTLADMLTEIADDISAAIDTVGEWQDAESGDDKAEAREQALEALTDVCNKAEFDLGECDVPEWLITTMNGKGN